MGKTSTDAGAASTPQTGSKTIQVEGMQMDITPDTTVKEVKEAVGAASDDLATYLDSKGDVVALADRDSLYREVPEGAKVSFQPAQGTVFG